MDTIPNSPARPSPYVSANTDLQNIYQDRGEFVVPEERIHDVSAAFVIAKAIYDADRVAGSDRSKLQAMVDGQPPYDQAELQRLGQGSRTNLNFGEANADFEAALAPYSELINGVDRILNVQLDYGSDYERANWEPIIAEEIDNTFKDWGKFYFEMERLNRFFVGTGVGITFFEDDLDWRFR